MRKSIQWLIVLSACAAFTAALVAVRIKKHRKERAGDWVAPASQALTRGTLPADVRDWYLITRAWSEGAIRDARAERVAIRISLFLNHGGKMDGRSVSVLLGRPNFSRQTEDGSISWGFAYPLPPGSTRWFVVTIDRHQQVTDHYFTDAQFKVDAAGDPIHGWEQTFPSKAEWKPTWDRIVGLP